MSLMKENGNEESSTEKKEFTTFESLAAYIWRSRARALKLSYDGVIMLVTMLRIVIGARQRLLDPLPRGYYGNAIMEACVTLTVRELNEKPLREVVKLIRDSIADFNNNQCSKLRTALCIAAAILRCGGPRNCIAPQLRCDFEKGDFEAEQGGGGECGCGEVPGGAGGGAGEWCGGEGDGDVEYFGRD